MTYSDKQILIVSDDVERIMIFAAITTFCVVLSTSILIGTILYQTLS